MVEPSEACCQVTSLSGYPLVRFTPEQRRKALMAPGVVCLTSDRGLGAVIGTEIAQLRKSVARRNAMASPLSRFACAHYAPPKPGRGSRVRRSNHGRPAMTEQRRLNSLKKYSHGSYSRPFVSLRWLATDAALFWPNSWHRVGMTDRLSVKIESRQGMLPRSQRNPVWKHARLQRTLPEIRTEQHGQSTNDQKRTA